MKITVSYVDLRFGKLALKINPLLGSFPYFKMKVMFNRRMDGSMD